MAKKKKKRGSARADSKSGKAQAIGGDADMQSALDEKEVAGEYWKPQNNGDSISGAVKSLGSEKGKYGLQMVSRLDTGPSGVYTIFLTEHMMRGFVEESVTPGDIIGIQFKGEADAKGDNNPMKLFAVVNKTQANELGDELKADYRKVYEFIAMKKGQELSEDDLPF